MTYPAPAQFASLSIGQSAELSKTITDQIVRDFAELSEDRNPVHLDDAYAATTIFKQRIAHGMITGALLSAVIANKLPGAGSVFLSSSLTFKSPVPIGDTVTAKVEIKELKAEKKIVVLACTCTRGDGVVVAEGDAVIKLFQ